MDLNLIFIKENNASVNMPGTNRLVARQLKNGFTPQQVGAMGVLGKYAKAPSNVEEKSCLSKLSIGEKKNLNIGEIKPENKNLANKFNKSKMDCLKNFENIAQREKDVHGEEHHGQENLEGGKDGEKKEGSTFDKLRWNLQKYENQIE